MVRFVVALLAFFIAVGAPIVTANNWGAGDSAQTRSIFCTGEVTNLSECTPQDMTQYFFESAIWPFTDANLEAEFHASRLNDYDSISEVSGLMTTSTSLADVFVYQRTTNPNWDMAYTTCSNGATTGYDDIRYYMWCKPQLLFFQDDSSAYTQCWNDDPCVKHFMCHEIGHTYGLQHTGDNDSCMEDNINVDTEVLRPHDRDHLIDCYPRPPEAGLPHWPAESRTTLCKDFE
jgi:hypothetical protein